MSKKKKVVFFKCCHCGKFISRDDFKEGKVGYYYEPDSHFGCEVIEHFHKRCANRKRSV